MGVAASAEYDLPSEQEVLRVLRSFAVRRARLFGSAARSELTPESDIDLLVEFDEQVDYGLIFRLAEALKVATGSSFDVLTSLKPPFRKYVEQDLVELPTQQRAVDVRRCPTHHDSTDEVALDVGQLAPVGKFLQGPLGSGDRLFSHPDTLLRKCSSSVRRISLLMHSTCDAAR